MNSKYMEVFEPYTWKRVLQMSNCKTNSEWINILESSLFTFVIP